jgi:FkbM family methyltransferase
MRIEDLTNYLKLRRIVSNPGEVLRFRKRQRGSEDLTVRFKQRPPLQLRGGCADFHMFHRIYLRDEYRLDPLLPGGLGTIVDLGGNIGAFTSRVAPHAKRVVTCEPVPVNFDRLQGNVGEYPNVTLLNTAVTDQDGTMEIHMPARGHETGVFSAHRQGNESKLAEDSVTVSTISLRSLFEQQQIQDVDLMKIDIEGGEYDVLYGAPELLAGVQRIHGEYHDVRPEDPRTRVEYLESFLREQGFARLEIIAHKKMPNHGMFFAARS